MNPRPASRRSIRRASAFVLPLLVFLLAPGASPVRGQEPDRPPPPAVPLHFAALSGNAAAVAQHVAAGSDLDPIDAFGATPLLVATTFGRTEVVRILMEAGADPAIPNAEGSTPLHVAGFLGRDTIAAILLAHGADPGLRSADGATVFDMAVVSVEDDRAQLDQLGEGLRMFGFRVDDGRVAAGRAAILERLAEEGTGPAAVDFAPLPEGGWPVSTPGARGMDPALVAQLYTDAAALESIRSLLVVKDGALVAERYFNDGAVGRPTLIQSVTKSVTSALVGIALEEGCLQDLDTPMLDFFPREAAAVGDPRKAEITLRQMLRMRAGYGYEPGDSVLWAGLTSGNYLPQIVDFPLERAPGSGFEYSNLTSHLLGVIVSRACGADLAQFAQTRLFDPLGVDPGTWETDADGYRYGYAGLHLTARDMARFGLLYLNDGIWDGRRVLPEGWVDASLTGHSTAAGSAILPNGTIGRYFREVEYGSQWWSARVDGRRLDFAWGYGGQLIVLLRDLDLVLVVTSDPFVSSDRVYLARKAEQAAFNVVGKFIGSLPRAVGDP